MKLWKIAFNTTIRRKSIFFLMLGVCSLSIATVIMALTATNSIVSTVVDRSAERFGEHHVVVNHVSSSMKEAISKSNAVHEVGQYQLFGTTLINNLTVSLGWMDQKALQLGRISVIEGTLPEKTGEVAIEAHVADLTGVTLNSMIEMMIHGNSHQYRVVGIIRDYTYEWTLPDDIIRGENDYPNILLSNADKVKLESQTSHVNNHLLVYLSDNKIETLMQNYYLFIKSLHIEQGLFNFKAYYLTDYANAKLFSRIFLTFVFIVTLICSLCIFMMYGAYFKKNIAIFKTVGANKTHLHLLLGCQCIIIVLGAAFIGFPIGLALKSIFINQIYSAYAQMNFLSEVSHVSLWLLFIYLIFFLAGIFSLKQHEKRYLSGHLSGVPNFIHYIIKKFPFMLKYSLLQWTNFFRYKLFAVITISMSILILFFSQVYAGESTPTISNVDYSVMSKTTILSKTIGNFEIIENQKSYFEYDQVKILTQLPGVTFVDRRPYAEGSVLISENTPKTNAEFVPYNHVDKQSIIPDARFITVDDEMFELINKQYANEQIPLNEFKNTPSLILFVPESAQQLISINDFGDSVSIGRLEYESGGNDMQLLTWDFGIQKIINKPYAVKVKEYVQQSNGITAVLHENHTEISEIFPGYVSLDVYLQDGLSETKKKLIDQTVKNLAASIPGSSFYSKEQYLQQEQPVIAILKYWGIFLFVMMMIFSVVSIIALVYTNILIKQKEYAVLQTLGLSSSRITLLFYIEVIGYFLFAGLISAVIFIMFLISDAPYSILIKYKHYYFLAMFITMIAALIGTYFLAYSLKKKSITERLKKL